MSELVRDLSLAIVTDIHHGTPKLTKRSDAALSLLNEFVDFVNEWPADLVIDLGDRISDQDNATDRSLTADVADVFRRVIAPRRHIAGNHDVEYMSREEGSELLGTSLLSESVDVKGFHLVFWQAGVAYDREDGFRLSKGDIDWLAADLMASQLPSIVFSHVPLDGGSMTGNYYFEANPHCAQYKETAQIRKVLRETGNVILCVAGHAHWNKANTVDGIPYLTLQSLTESFTTNSAPTSAWSTLEIAKDIHWRCHGADPIDVRLPLAQRWEAPLPAFDKLRKHNPIGTACHPLQGVRAVLFDLDGVVYRGDKVIPGAPELFAYLHDTGRVVGAITNNALRTRAGYSEKLASMGINLSAEYIFTSGWATARYIMADLPSPEVFVVGGEALHLELFYAGVKESNSPDYVVAGIDLSLSLKLLSEAAIHVRNGARLIITNPDLTVPTEDGIRAGAGAVQAFIEAASAEVATVIGKPMPGMYLQAMDRLSVKKSETIMVGDTMETDILGASTAGIRSVLVESGNANSSITRPNLRVSDAAGLHEAFMVFDRANNNP